MLNKLETAFAEKLQSLKEKGTLKSPERVITGTVPAENGFGSRVIVEGEKQKFIRFNSNSYLALGRHPDVIEAEELAVKKYGCGPGAVRFISGTSDLHVTLERRLADFHGREDAILFSSAYAAVLGVLPPLISEKTVVISDALNHNCIINAIRLSQPWEKEIYPHLDVASLENLLTKYIGRAKRVIVVTDGIFSMRGKCAPLKEIITLCDTFSDKFQDGIITVVDDSHGVGAIGATGKGTEEVENARADILIATLGKAFGVNGGYAVSNKLVVEYLRETAPLYIYSNPIGPGEAAAALASLKILESREGKNLLARLKEMSEKLRTGIKKLNLETIDGLHPIVPLLLRNTELTSRLGKKLFEKGILATGLAYPVVPSGEEEIRFQINCEHTEKDIDYLLNTLAEFFDAGS